ncbi:MAG: Mur ligase domain-containing protein [Spirochaetota bacterium]
MNIHLIGIGGVAMGNLAYMLKLQGHTVSGSDLNIYPPMSDKLKEWGFTPHIGYSADNIKGADLVIVGNAISRGNPEVEELLNLQKEYMSMPEAISRFFLKGKKVIVVSGTHGKTTTTFLIHHILKEAGLSPGLFVGGIRKDGHPGFEIGEGEYFVIEGDEYDSAFFDKSSKFLHYKPYYLIITSLDYDHADIFSDLDAIKTMFRRLINLVPSRGKIYYWENSENLKEICSKFKYSPLHPYELGNAFSAFIEKKGNLYCKENEMKAETSLIGTHNYRNIEVAMNLCSEIIQKKPSILLSYLESFPGVKRRQEILWQSPRTIIMEDFAHHPVAIEETIKGVKKAYPKYKILSLFEPRSATSHRNVFQQEFAESFTEADYVMITEIFNINKVPEEIRLDVKKIIKTIQKNTNILAEYSASPSEIPQQVKKVLQSSYQAEKVLILAMSNGSFGGIYKQLIDIVKDRE